MVKKIFVLGVILVMCLGLFNGCKAYTVDNGEIIAEEPFYSLQAAYNCIWLTKENLQSIASMHINKQEVTLDEELSSEIKQAYTERYPRSGKTVDDVIIDKYYGTYNDCTALMNETYYAALMIRYDNDTHSTVIGSEIVGGVEFNYSEGERILIYKIIKGKIICEEPFYSLQAAYNNNWLTKENLQSIAFVRNNKQQITLDEELSSEIKQSYTERYSRSGKTADNVIIDKYYGTYNDCAILMIRYDNDAYTTAIERETVGGIKFTYPDSRRILIYKK